MNGLKVQLQSALDALEGGDVRAAERIILDLLDGPPKTKPYTCKCGNSFEWPGLLEAHTFRCAHLLEDAA